jgi:RNA polymerase sigma-70 factor (ECF subfamily)
MTDRRGEFEAVALTLLPVVYRTAVGLSGNADEARDLVQDTYLRAYRTFENFAPGTNCKAWLLTILHSVFVNRYRKARRDPLALVHGDEAALDQMAGPNPSHEGVDALGRTTTDAEIERALAQLPEEYRVTVLLVDVEELSYEEAATVLQCPIGTIRSRLARARKMLAASLREHAKRAGYVRATGGEE